MKVDLIKYMSERMLKGLPAMKEPGPVVTISRLYGCPANEVAIRLTEELNRKIQVKHLRHSWKWINKEILYESAKVLEMDPEKIEYVFEYEHKSLIDEVLNALSSKYYKSDRTIRKTIQKVIHNIAYEGHVIIVGRGGVAITRHFPRSLHVNLEAPQEWRALRISEKQHIPVKDAREKTHEMDLARLQFREYFGGKNTDYTWFDITFNTMTLSVDEIADSIAQVMELRGFI